MRPEYRSSIDGKYAKKIESIVRKAPKDIRLSGGGNNEDDDDGSPMAAAPCPVCNTNLPAMEVSCHKCKTTLPICIATVSFDFVIFCYSFIIMSNLKIIRRVSMYRERICPLVLNVIFHVSEIQWQGKTL